MDMKKTVMATAILMAMGSGAASAAFVPVVTTTGNNFTMLTATGGGQGGTNDVTFTWDGTLKTASDGIANATLSSPTPFSGNVWTAKNVEIFGAGTYNFVTNCLGNATPAQCAPLPASYNLTVGAGQVGAHMLFDWSTSANIDVIVLWKMNDSWFNVAGTYLAGTSTVKNAMSVLAPNLNNNTKNTVWNGVSIDTTEDTDNWNGTKMIDGPFIGSSANFNIMGIQATPLAAPVPVPAAAWLLGSGLLGLVGVARRKAAV